MTMRTPVLYATLVLSVSLVCAERAASAGILKSTVKKGVGRVRRAVSIGPTLGGALVFAPAGPDVDGNVSFGLALFTFEQKIIDEDRIKDFVKDKLIEAAMRRGEMTPEQREELIAEIKAEARAQLEPPETKRPKPLFDFAIEGAYGFRAEAWQFRLSFGFGVGPVTIGPTAVVYHVPGATSVALGPEVALHLLPGKGPRPTAIQIFARGDFFLSDRDAFDDLASVGVRVLFDVF